MVICFSSSTANTAFVRTGGSIPGTGVLLAPAEKDSDDLVPAGLEDSSDCSFLFRSICITPLPIAFISIVLAPAQHPLPLSIKRKGKGCMVAFYHSLLLDYLPVSRARTFCGSVLACARIEIPAC